MRNIISFVHISLDGFITGPNGEIDWIIGDAEIFDHIGNRLAGTDTALYGRKTFEMMEHYWPTAGDKTTATQHDIDHAQWYTGAHKIVLSTTMQDPERSDITIIGDNLLEQIDAIKQQPGKDIFIFGSPTATHALMKHNRIDEYWLFVNPIILGHGVPLFQGIRETMTLNLLTTRRFACGVMELNYAVNREISRKQNEGILL